MQGLLRAATAAFAAILGFGLFAAVQSTTASADDLSTKPEDSVSVLSTDDGDDDEDEDEDEDPDTDAGATDVNTDASGVSNDATSSRVTSVSRDRDVSNGDLTKDRTMDGGDPTRDLTQNHTNDQSRNDTR